MDTLAAEAKALRQWLFEQALPMWWAVGADMNAGGFHEAIGLDGKPVDLPHRARSITRQAIAYCEAGRLGWNGPWAEAALHALDYFQAHFTAPDGTVVSVVNIDGTVHDPTRELYDQAFALLALAHAHRCFGGAWRARAVTLRDTLKRTYADTDGGFREPSGKPPGANPHMHLFEAALAWVAIDDAEEWQAMADGLAALCLQRLINPLSVVLREFFHADWSPADGIAGRIVEPGHQYEWAFLLHRRSGLTKRPLPAAIDGLIAFADRYGCDPRRGIAVNSVLMDGTVHDPTARLWAQAERIRAYAARRRAADDQLAAIKGLRRFLDTPVAGLWFDRLTEHDRMILEPARATSLYHLVGAVAELDAQAG